jgi:hypothetical protein
MDSLHILEISISYIILYFLFLILRYDDRDDIIWKKHIIIMSLSLLGILIIFGFIFGNIKIIITIV